MQPLEAWSWRVLEAWSSGGSWGQTTAATDGSGKSLADVDAASLGSKAKLSRIESGKGPVKIADVRALCWLYGVSDETTDALTALAPGTQQDDWWEAYGTAVVPDWFGLYAGLEAAEYGSERLSRSSSMAWCRPRTMPAQP